MSYPWLNSSFPQTHPYISHSVSADTTGTWPHPHPPRQRDRLALDPLDPKSFDTKVSHTPVTTNFLTAYNLANPHHNLPNVQEIPHVTNYYTHATLYSGLDIRGTANLKDFTSVAPGSNYADAHYSAQPHQPYTNSYDPEPPSAYSTRYSVPPATDYQDLEPLGVFNSSHLSFPRHFDQNMAKHNDVELSSTFTPVHSARIPSMQKTAGLESHVPTQSRHALDIIDHNNRRPPNNSIPVDTSTPCHPVGIKGFEFSDIPISHPRVPETANLHDPELSNISIEKDVDGDDVFTQFTTLNDDPVSDAHLEGKLPSQRKVRKRKESDVSRAGFEKKARVRKKEPKKGLRYTSTQKRRANPKQLRFCADPTCKTSREQGFRGFRTKEDGTRHGSVHGSSEWECPLEHPDNRCTGIYRRKDGLRK